jgi:hypothetical protein
MAVYESMCAERDRRSEDTCHMDECGAKALCPKCSSRRLDATRAGQECGWKGERGLVGYFRGSPLPRGAV